VIAHVTRPCAVFIISDTISLRHGSGAVRQQTLQIRHQIKDFAMKLKKSPPKLKIRHEMGSRPLFGFLQRMVEQMEFGICKNKRSNF
jgi:hypothetical protein